MKGKFVLSYYEHLLGRELYPNCRIIPKNLSWFSQVKQQNKKNKSKGIAYNELLEGVLPQLMLRELDC